MARVGYQRILKQDRACIELQQLLNKAVGRAILVPFAPRSHCTGLQITREEFGTEHFVFGNRITCF